MRVPLLIIFLNLLFLVASAGHQQFNDSLKNVIATSKVDTTQMRAKWILGKSYFRTGNLEYFDAFRSGLQQATDINNSRWKQEFTLYIGISHLLSGNNDSAIFYLDKCKSMKDAETTTEITYQVHFNLGQAYNSKGNTKETTKYLLEALQYVTEPNSAIKKSNIYHNLSTLMSNLGEEKKAFEYNMMGIRCLNEKEHPDKLVMLYSTLSGFYFGLGKKDSALISIQKAIALAEPLPSKEPLAYAYINLITYYTQSNQPDSAEFYFNEIKPYYEAGIRKDESYSFLVFQMAEIAFQKKEYKKAESLYMEADSLAEVFSYHVQKLQIKKSIAAFYEATGNSKAALNTMKEYYFLKDSIESKESSAQSKELEQKYSVSEKQKEIELLQKEKEKQGVVRNAVISVASLTSIIGLILFFGFRNRGRMNNQLEEKNKIIESGRQRAIRSEQFKQKFLANMSHELRSPMNAMLGSVTLALKQEDIKASRKYLEMAQRSSKYLLGIINDILDLSKIEAGKLVFEQIPFNMYQAAQDVISAQSLHLNKDKQTLIFESNFNSELKVIGDPLRIMQVLTNLVNNAIKFTPAGKITVNINHDEQKESFQISVTDEGIGINSEDQGRLFQSYQQTETGTARKYGGTGLGLAITKQLVELMNGTITVHSQEGQGTTFIVTLKLICDSGNEIANEGEPENTNMKFLEGISIYVVDDLEENRIVTADLLKSILTNINVSTFSNGKELIDALKQTEIQFQDKLCILTDLDMPVMNGIDSVGIIRNKMNLSVPIIALTASVFVGDDEEFSKMGFDGMVIKPFTASVLIDTMALAMRRKASGL